MEQWKPAVGFESTHEVSNYGNVRGYKRKKIMKPSPDKRGYLRLSLSGTTIKVHRLVSQTFIPNPDNKPQVNHLDGDKTNNYDWNLEWSTQKENMEHASRNGYYKNNKSPVWESRKKKVIAYTKQGEFFGKYESIQEAARQTNSQAPNIHHVLTGKLKTHNGFIWKEE